MKESEQRTARNSGLAQMKQVGSNIKKASGELNERVVAQIKKRAPPPLSRNSIIIGAFIMTTASGCTNPYKLTCCISRPFIGRTLP